MLPLLQRQKRQIVLRRVEQLLRPVLQITITQQRQEIQMINKLWPILLASLAIACGDKGTDTAEESAEESGIVEE